MATENLKVKITADASQAKAEIGKFKDTLKSSVSAGDSATKTIAKLTAATGALAVAIKAVKSAVKNAVQVAAMGDAIKDNAQKVFMGTTAYQEWGYVLKQNGIEIGALKVGMRQFAQQVANGSNALTKYGITATDVDTAFNQAIATIQNMSTETEKIAAATELFGSRALELFPILNLTNAETQSLMATYRAIGGTMSNELIAASDVCTDSITEMKMAWGGLRNLLAAYVIPVITRIVQWLTLAIAKIRILLAAFLGVKETFGSGGKKSPVATTGSIAKNTGGAAKNLKRAAKHAKELKRTLMGIDELSRLAEKATSSAGSGGSSGGGGSVGVGGVGVGDVGSFDGIISGETLDKLEKFQEKVDLIKDKLHGAYLILKGLAEIATGNFSDGLKDLGAGIELIFPKVSELKEKWEDLKKRIIEKIEATFNIKIPSWDDLKEKWEKLKGKFTGKTAKIGIKIPSWGDWKKKWQNLKDKFQGKTVKFGLKFTAAASDLKSWINSHVIDKINNKFKQVPILKNHLIPHLARGGVLTAPTTALLGEYAGARSNPEIATPQSLMYETIQRANGDLVSAVAMMTRQVITAIENKDLDVRIGDEAIARSAQRGNTAYYNRTGKALLSI